MKIPFSPPLINEQVKKEVNESLDSGWITTGPKVKLLEEQIKSYTEAPKVLCVNSWTSGAILMLKWFGLQEGDEVILPAYTYAATALAVIHAGGKPVMVDVCEDFNMDPTALEKAITAKTKAVIPVDIAGMPCDYDTIYQVIESKKSFFQADNPIQGRLGRILVLSDAAHSIGASYKGKMTGVLADVTVFSLHAVKNVTTAEGGAICINMPKPFDNEELYNQLRCYALNGQTKDAFTKTKAGAWKYDIIYPGLKINMPDVLAAIGIGQMAIYHQEVLPIRRALFKRYNNYFSKQQWAINPQLETEYKQSSCHLYALRIKGIDSSTRDKIIEDISTKGIAVNVHFQPLPLLSLFKQMGYQISDYPNAYAQFENEISLPIYPQLSNEAVDYINQSITEVVLAHIPTYA
ncbi:MAG: DegT/DnrJ/EryC1/StrS aminotransferase family protein [Flavobacteriaceae bacterium]|nr:DegT/DnrJ/EryC1/StrS aminotransferase family protein [Flavobacteriaceae bacterium]